MRIGVDIDDTITDTKVLIDCLKELEFADKKTFTEDEYEQFLRKYDDYIHQNVTLKKGVKEAFNWLKEKGIDIYLITSRGIYSKNSKNDTIEFLNKNNIPYDYLICCAKKKERIAKRHGISLFIDDLENICDSMENEDIMSIRVCDIEENSGLKRAFSNWEEILCFLKLYIDK